MKIIDEKGRLFGRLNLIDCLAIIVVLIVLGAVGLKVLRDRSNNPINASTTLEYVVRVNGIEQSFLEEIARYVDYGKGESDQLMASGEMLPGEVVDYWFIPHVRYLDNDTTNEIRVDEGPYARVDVFFKIQARVSNPEVNEVGTQEVRTGKPHIVKTAHFEFTYGTVQSCRWDDGVKQW